MADTATESAPPNTAPAKVLCAHCGCDLGGHAPDAAGEVLCPECARRTKLPPPRKETLAETLKKLGPVAVLGAIASILPPLGSIVLFWKINTIGPWLQAHDLQGVLLYAGAFALLSGIAIVPTYASSVLGGWAFGFAMGYPAALVGFVGGSIIGYFIGRGFAKDRVVALIHEHPRWQTVKDALIGSSTLRTLVITTLVRLAPNSPFALTNYFLSSLRIPLWIYALATLLGMAPRTAITVFIASSLQNKLIEEAAEEKPWWLVGISIAVTVVVFIVIGTIATKALHHATRKDPEPQKA